MNDDFATMMMIIVVRERILLFSIAKRLGGLHCI